MGMFDELFDQIGKNLVAAIDRMGVAAGLVTDKKEGPIAFDIQADIAPTKPIDNTLPTNPGMDAKGVTRMQDMPVAMEALAAVSNLGSMAQGMKMETTSGLDFTAPAAGSKPERNAGIGLLS